MTAVKLEALRDGAWEDLSRYVAEGSVEQQHRMREVRVAHRARQQRPMGPRTRERLVAYVVRVKARPMLIEQYGPSGNPTVAECRAERGLVLLDRAQVTKQGPGGKGPTPPNRRLATFGMRVVLDDSAVGWHLEGGTPRQRKCYLRAVARWTRATA